MEAKKNNNEICKTKMQMKIIIVTYETIKHKMKQTRLWCKIVL